MVAGVWKSEFTQNLIASMDIRGNPATLGTPGFNLLLYAFWAEGSSETGTKYAALHRHRSVYSLD